MEIRRISIEADTGVTYNFHADEDGQPILELCEDGICRGKSLYECDLKGMNQAYAKAKSMFKK